jgi:CRISPR-associated protein Cpf1
MGGHFKDFTKLYSLNKTLRFELIPQGETSERIIAKWLDDTERAESYSKVKSLIDCRHREIINEVLGKFQFADKELNDLNSENVNADEDELDDFDNDKNNPSKKIRERLSKELTEKASMLFSDKLINQSNEDGKCNLEIWLEDADDEQLELGNNEKVNRKTIIKDIKKMGRFWTYFGGFNENRKNIYSKVK